MKLTTVRFLLAGVLAIAPAGALAEGANPIPGDHTPIAHDRTPSTQHGATSGPRR